ncbi:unnamed protein product [Schistocephalus solidus]|uniref:Uncharacterized protein n=1 Tax=Schistocephalus solidus TaxID=70667 RepID=A0A3P7DQX2_SCHSO|nr:unnamed protein product [Schistocephalus solidus]
MLELSLLLVDLAPVDHVRYLLRFLAPSAHKLAMTSGISLLTPFHSAEDKLLLLFDNQSFPSVAGERLYNLRQTQQPTDDLATELIQLARQAFPNLPSTDHNDLELDRFISAHFFKLKPYRGHLPVCTADSLPILPAGQVPPVAIEFGSVFSILGNLFEGDIFALPSHEFQRLDSLVHLVASETSDRQKRNNNFLLKNVSRERQPIDVAVDFLYACGFNYKIAEAKRLSSRSKNPPILVTLFSPIEVDSIFAQRGRISRYLEVAKCFLCRDLTPMERRNVSPLLHRSSASQSVIHKSGHGYANHNATVVDVH